MILGESALTLPLLGSGARPMSNRHASGGCRRSGSQLPCWRGGRASLFIKEAAETKQAVQAYPAVLTRRRRPPFSKRRLRPTTRPLGAEIIG